MATNHTSEPGQFAQTYYVPRRGTPVPRTVHDRDNLRVLRTELELLSRIKRRAATQPPIEPPSPGRFSPDDREELAQILDDARHPIVEEMIALIDRDFGDLRKEILMSVVNEQAEDIVQEAVECGALSATGSPATYARATPGRPPSASPADPAPARRVGTEGEKVSPEANDYPTARNDDIPATDVHTQAEAILSATEADPPVEEIVPAMDDALAAAEAELARVVDSNSEADEGDDTADLEAIEAVDEAATTPVAGRIDAVRSAGGDYDAAFSPKGAEHAVTEIEMGIRKLAAVLSTEVNEQWRQARESFEQLEAARARTEEAEGKAAAMLEEIARLKEETRIARDDADVARREARLLRKGARIAKERADASAIAAEAAADQASREANHARKRAT